MEINTLNYLQKKLHIRNDLIAHFILNKNVVHYGCTDDSIGNIDSKIKNNIYLHKLVTDKSNHCIGIDINSDLIEYLKHKYAFNNIYYGDVENPATFEIEFNQLKQADILIIPDLIEHLNNPGLMLEGIKKYYSKKIKLIIVTPNPFTYLNFAFTLLRREFYNAFHTCCFSTTNMRVLLSHYDIRIIRVYPCFMPKDKPFIVRTIDKLINHFLLIFSSGFCDNYLYECEFIDKG
jgi:2-polyprenyl-3-methyl-5-hydroxy-6-metoxy-1,4-benzoquinol methylase